MYRLDHFRDSKFRETLFKSRPFPLRQSFAGQVGPETGDGALPHLKPLEQIKTRSIFLSAYPEFSSPFILSPSKDVPESCPERSRRVIEGSSRILINLVFMLSCMCSIQAKKFTIMISPEGDSNTPGRALGDGFERGFTRQYAQALKEQLEQNPEMRIIVSHEAGEAATQEHKANLANRLTVDLYLSINFHEDEKPSMSIYYCQTALFDAPVDTHQLTLYPTNKAYVKNHALTKKWATHWHMLKDYQTQLHVNQPLPAPLKQLEGVLAPAFALDLGAQKMVDIYAYVKPVTEVLMDISHEQNN